ncbi:MAG: TolB family protein [Chloroflexota bacterium]
MKQAQFDRIEARLPELLSDLGAARVPDYFDDMLQQTGRSRQRPAWSLLERWLPMGVIARPALASLPAWRPILIGVLVVLAVVAGALIYVGSRPTPLPPPFGPAGNGNLYFTDARGDVFAMDPATFTPRTIIAGRNQYRAPLPSRDGRLIAFLKGDQVFLANSDGSNVRALPGHYPQIEEQDWSADSAHLGIRSVINGKAALTILNADGSGAKTLSPKGDLEVGDFSFLPDERILFFGTGTVASSDTWGIYTMNADGTDARPIVPPSRRDGDFIAPLPSPDGKSVIYFVWRDPDEHGVLYSTDIATGKSHKIGLTDNAQDEYEVPQFSPDGTKILVSRFNECCRTLTIASVEGGPPIDIGERIDGGSGPVASAFFSPDGTSVIAWYPNSRKLWLLDPTGVKPDREIGVALSDAPTWQRIAMP